MLSNSGFKNVCSSLAWIAGVTAAMPSLAAEPIKVMLIDPMSGPQSATVERASKNLQYAIKRQNDAGGLKGRQVELVTCDSKFNPKDGKNCLDRAIGDDIHYVFQGVGSNVTLTLLDGIEKYNARNPGKEIVLMNWAGLDEEMTNKYCSFWQFRTDAHIGMKVKALVTWLAADPSIKRAYLINMDYSMGQGATASAIHFLKQMRPDIEIVGSELHPANRVQDFTPYVAKIRASRADVVITSNIGTDLNRLVRAGNDIGLNVRWVTTYASQYGQVTAIGQKGVDHIFQAGDSIMSMDEPALDKLQDEWRAAGQGDFESIRIYRSWLFLSNSIAKVGPEKPLQVAKAIEGMTVSIGGYQASMRATDHQAQLPLNISVLSTAAKYKQESTPWGFKLLKVYPAAQMSEPTTCQMKRPSGA
ncbi:branched-chain amino acid ABC transporter substrate-binding protein [Undibacterium sp. TJN25]|uniref:branched-chain amino acid ABC transporter substrate-binding protein n=1 Tax=Undibacterium sp. TJN25 TaxID=3413056 RepID=UPI003BF39723